MRKKSRILSIALVICLLFSFSAVAMAANEANSAEIQVNGEIISYPSGTNPYYDAELGRVYIPFRDLFVALGAEVDYDDETSTAVAVRDDVTVEYVLGSDTFKVIRGEDEKVMTSEVKPINIDGRVLVPVRFVSESIGANVGWDSAARTVLIVDPYMVAKANTNTYEMFDKLLAAAATAETAKTQEVQTAIDVSISITEGDATIELPISATMDAIVSDTALDAAINLKVDLAALLGEALTAELDIDAQLIYNMNTGLFALQSDSLIALIDQLIGLSSPSVPAGTWITLDTSAMLLEITALAGDINAADYADITSLRGILDAVMPTVVSSVPLTSVDDYAELSKIISLLYDMYADESFTKDGDTYTAKQTISEDGVDMTIIYSLTLDAAGTASAFSAEMTVTDTDGTDISFSITTDDSDLAASIVVKSQYVNVTCDISAETKDTTKTPRTDVPAGAAKVALEDILG